MPTREIEAELRKVAQKAADLAKMLRGNVAEIGLKRGVLKLGPLIRAAQGHPYHDQVDIQEPEDPRDWDLSSGHRCRMFTFYQMALEGDPR